MILLHSSKTVAYRRPRLRCSTGLSGPAGEKCETAQKARCIEIIKEYKKIGVDTVIVQVRPCSDRIWAHGKNKEPWSSYITSMQGRDPQYDPLQSMIEETHKLGLQFHAAINPFRVNTNAAATLTKDHPANRPGYKIIYGSEKDGFQAYYDPAVEGVQKLTLNAITQIIENYDFTWTIISTRIK
jgi:uncharacterized lipoprotein YddW (UPF0748 family)